MWSIVWTFISLSQLRPMLSVETIPKEVFSTQVACQERQRELSAVLRDYGLHDNFIIVGDCRKVE